MTKPVILVVDDDPGVLQEIGRDLRWEYAARFRILSAESGSQALEAVQDLERRNHPIALFLVDQRMPGMTGTEFLKQAIRIYPRAKRVLLTAYSDTKAAIEAINEAQIDYYLLKPWTPAEEKLYPVLDDLLDGWQASYHPPYQGVRVLGHHWSAQSYDLKDFLQKNQVPYQWLDVEINPDAIQLLTQLGLDQKRLPVVLLPDGKALATPQPYELGEALGLSFRAEKPFYDLAIVGAGPAGLAAAVYGASEGLRTVLFEKEAPGGQAGSTSKIENYLGFPAGLSGGDLARRAVSQAKRFGTEILCPVTVNKVSINGPYRVVDLSDGSQVSCHVLLVACGASYRRLEVPGADRLIGSGVYYGTVASDLSYCEGQTAVVVGGGNSAGQAALYLSGFAQNVLMLVRGKALSETMSQYLIERLVKTPNVEIRFTTEVIEVQGDDRIKSIKTRNLSTSEVTNMDVVSLFVFIGAKPMTNWLEGTVALDRYGFILTGPDLPRGTDGRPVGWPLQREPNLLETNVPGIYAAGDARHASVKRIASAVGEGAIAITFAHQYLTNL